MNSIFVVDTETSGIFNFSRDFKDGCQPYMVQVAGLLCNSDGRIVRSFTTLVKPTLGEPPLSNEVIGIHGITDEMREKYGIPLEDTINRLHELMDSQYLFVAHNALFDYNILETAHHRAGIKMIPMITQCTMLDSTPICKIEKKNNKGYKWPKLPEAYDYFFGEILKNEHDGLHDALACKRIYFEGLKQRVGSGGLNILNAV